MSAVAIVGMGCRFGGAPDLHAFWKLVLEGRNSFQQIPKDRFDVDVYYDDNRRAVDKTYARVGGFVDDVRTFPGLHYGIPPRRIEVMDPQHRFALEVSVQAIEDSGRTAKEMPRRTGVFMGALANEYRSMLSARVMAQTIAAGQFGHVEDPIAILRSVENIVPSRPYSASGALFNMMAATVAQELDFHGPAYTVDSACASSLVALSNAVAELRAGTIDAAIAGGVYLQLTAEHFIAFCRVGAMSQQGLCLPFDARADGFVQGDGAVAVMLKRQEDAERDGDRIYALIHGVSTNNDGRGDGPMAPNSVGQADAIALAWEHSGIEKAKLGYIEAHGTGTDVGDVTEFRGLMDVFGGHATHAALGSAKANVGHTNSAAGVAGIIKTALAIHHGVIPPMSGFESPKADLHIDESPFYVPTQPTEWAGERYAGVSSFGFGGTNAHAVLGQAPVQAAQQIPVQAELLLMSARDEVSLRDLAARTADQLQNDARLTVAGVIRAWAARPPQTARVAIPSVSRDQLVARLRAFGNGETPSGVRFGLAPKTAPKLAWMFPGQGSQRLGLLADIAGRFPIVAQTLASIESDLGNQLSVPLTHLLWPERRKVAVSEDQARAELTDTANQQPALHAANFALATLLQSLGVHPTVVTGHSLGEFTAAAVAGVLSASDAAGFVARRGRAMADLPGDHGAMAAVMADEATVAGLLVNGAVIANKNHPRQLVVSGTRDAVAAVIAKADAANIKAVALDVSHAFHSPVLATLDPEPILANISLSAPKVTVASGIADRPYADADDARGVFRRHATSPVDFVRALAQCVEAGAEVFVQVGAGGPLGAFARGCLPKGTLVVPLAGQDDHDGGLSLLDGLGALFVAGVPVDVRAITAAATVASVAPILLPREEYWAIKNEPQHLPKWSGAEVQPQGAQTTPKAPNTAPVAEAPEAPVTDEVLDRVLTVIARVSAYPKASLRVEMGLQEDLGFDSLMVGDLATGLADAFPGLGGIPQELLINKPSVGDMVDYARGAGSQAAKTVDDDLPLDAYRPVWRLAGLPPAHRSPKGRLFAIVGSGPLAASLATAFSATGAEASVVDRPTAASLDRVDALVVTSADAPALISLLAAHDKAGRRPDVLGIDLNDAANAVLRSLAREWPTSTIKAIRLGSEAANHVVAEWANLDRSVDVKHEGGRRYLMGLEVAPSASKFTPGPAESVVITGGTRGIGARLGARLVGLGCKVYLIGRGQPDESGAAAIAAGAIPLVADVTDAAALKAVVPPGVTAVVHAAGVLADGPIGDVSGDTGSTAWRIKVDGFANAIAAAGPSLKVALAVGSWAARFGNRHQTWYGAANAALADVKSPRTVVAEFGPWTKSAMVQSIPAPVQQAMRAEGVDFVGDTAGLDALIDDLSAREGVIVHGRDLAPVLRHAEVTEVLSTATHPYLLDHAIEGTPVLPLASATDLLATAAGVSAPFEIRDLRLFQGVIVKEPVTLRVIARNDRVELRQGDKNTLSYRARIRELVPTEAPAKVQTGPGVAPTLSLKEFYSGLTFHGPALQGIVRIDEVGETFIRGRVRAGKPAAWIPDTGRSAFTVDPLVFDSAMQLSGYVAYTRYKRAGTPVGFARYTQYRAISTPELDAVVTFGPIEGDRFTGTIELSDDKGVVAIAEAVAADMRAVPGEEAPLVLKPEWTDFGLWPQVKDLEGRLAAAEMIGLRIPYFSMNEGTARDTTVINGRTLVNFSSYNYLGLSGDPRVLDDVTAAIHKYGTSVSASRVASGERPFHRELELELAAAQGQEDAILFTAGHATNVTTIGHLMGPNDLILHDELIHDSALQGIKLSGAVRRSFKHDRAEDLERQLKALRANFEKVLIVVEGVYSMDGDICDLPAFVALKKKYGCLLLVDEAHSFGVIGETGSGIAEHYGIPGHEIDLFMGTLSKSLSSCGGWIAGNKRVINYLKYTAPGFVYSAGLTPSNGQAALSSLRLMLQENWRVKKLQSNARFFQQALVARGIDTGPSLGGSGVVPAVTGNSMHAILLSQRLQDQGINVQPIVYPAVADDASRLRFFLSSTHSEEQLQFTAETVANTLAQIRLEYKV